MELNIPKGLLVEENQDQEQLNELKTNTRARKRGPFFVKVAE